MRAPPRVRAGSGYAYVWAMIPSSGHVGSNQEATRMENPGRIVLAVGGLGTAAFADAVIARSPDPQYA